MKVVGLTGGVGMGKSTCADLIRARGLPLVDTDDLAREVVKPGQPAVAEIRKAFGADFVDEHGALRRSEMAGLAFVDARARKKLEKILHPRIRNLWRGMVEDWRGQGKLLAIVVIPLLFETKAEQELDATICVACSPATQQARLQSRCWSAEQIQQRLQAQWPIEQKILHSNYVLWNEANLDVLLAQLERVLRTLNGNAGGRSSA